MAMAAAASSSSTRCAPFTCRRGIVQAPAAAAASSGQGCGRPLVSRAAGLVGGGIAAAFFASLERCACVEVRTADDLVPDSAVAGDSEAEPLMRQDDDAAGNRVTATKQGRRTAVRAGARKGRKSGGLVGWCENVN